MYNEPFNARTMLATSLGLFFPRLMSAQVARWLRSWAMAGGGAAAQQPACNGAGDGQSHARVERRQAAVMMALRLGVEGRVTVGMQTHGKVGGRAAGSGQMDTTA